MSNNKIQRINSELEKQISYVINYGLKDPRTKGGMISVLRVNAATDLKTAKVYLSFLNVEDPKETLKALRSAAGFIKNELKHRMDIRNIPDLTFVLDDSIEYGMKITDIINKLNITDDKNED